MPYNDMFMAPCTDWVATRFPGPLKYHIILLIVRHREVLKPKICRIPILFSNLIGVSVEQLLGGQLNFKLIRSVYCEYHGFETLHSFPNAILKCIPDPSTKLLIPNSFRKSHICIMVLELLSCLSGILTLCVVEISRGCLWITILFYQYRYSHHEYKTVSPPYIFIMGILYLERPSVFILRQGPDRWGLLNHTYIPTPGHCWFK